MSAAEIRFFNTLGRKLETFVPLAPGRVGLYTCGPTVYNHVHIGNLRTFLFEDLLKRALVHLGFDVRHVMNLTDVDDKTIRGAEEKGVPLDVFTQPYIDSFFADLKTLGVVPANEYPRATRHVPEMIAIVERLIEKGHAYLSDGSVWFRIASDPDYGAPLGRAGSRRRGRGSGSPTTNTRRRTCAISSSGRGPSRASRPGTPPGGRDARAGTSSARR